MTPCRVRRLGHQILCDTSVLTVLSVVNRRLTTESTVSTEEAQSGPSLEGISLIARIAGDAQEVLPSSRLADLGHYLASSRYESTLYQALNELLQPAS